MSIFGVLLAIALCAIPPQAVGSGRSRVDCDASCVADVKRETATYKAPFLGATDKQWQAAFDAAISELGQGDWGQRLSAIREAYCRPDKPDLAKADSLVTDMFKKWSSESDERIRHIDFDAAMNRPSEPSGIEALKQIRTNGLRYAILRTKVQETRVSCPPQP